MAKVCVAAGVNESLAVNSQEASLGVHDNPGNATVAPRLDAAEQGMEEHFHAGAEQQRVPHQFEPLGVVGHTGSGAVGIRPKEDVPREIKSIDDAIWNATDDLAWLVARGEEAIERVQDLCAGAAGKTVPLESTTDRPASAAAIAAQQPALPAPTITTSAW